MKLVFTLLSVHWESKYTVYIKMNQTVITKGLMKQKKSSV